MAGRRNNSESPLSLFSFQDIITGGTGIMIFILLMLAINVNKSKQDKIKDKQVNNKRRQLLEQYTRITNELTQVRKSYLKIKQQLAVYRRCDRDKLQQQIADTEFAIASRKLEEKALRDNIKKLQQSLPGKTARQKMLMEKIAELKLRYEELKKKLEQRKDFNRVEFIPANDAEGKQPILVQLSDQKIAVKTFAGIPEVYFWPNNAEGLKQFRKFAESRDSKLEYFCFLLKPSASKVIYQAPFLLMKNQPFVKPLEKKFDVGLEPLPEDKNAVYKQSP